MLNRKGKYREGQGIRDSAVSLRVTCCLLGVHCRCPQPFHTPHLLKYRYGHTTVQCAAVYRRDKPPICIMILVVK